MSDKQLDNPDLTEKISRASNSILEWIEEAFYEISSDSEMELYEKIKKLSKSNDDFFNASLNNLIEQINNSPSWEKRNLIEKQILELERLNILHKEYRETKMTNKTNKELSVLFNKILPEIEVWNEIKDEREKIERVILSEGSKLEDKYIDSSYRDLVEKHTNIKDKFLATIFENEQTETFYNIFTIEYINFLDYEKRWESISEKPNLEDWLSLDEESLYYIVNKTIRKLWLINKELEFDEIEFRINWWKKVIKISEVIVSMKKEIEKERLRQEIVNDYSIITKLFKENDYNWLYSGNDNSLSKEWEKLVNSFKEKTKLFSREEIFSLLEDLDKEKEWHNNRFLLVPFIEALWFWKKVENSLEHWLQNHILWKQITIWTNKIEFNSEFIEKNRDTMSENLKVFYSYMMIMETSWWRLDMESTAWAKWVVQFLDWHKGWEKVREWQWSFETALNRWKKYWWDKVPDYLIEATKWEWQLKTDKFWPDKQLALWIPDTIMRNWKALELFMWILVWNTWSAKKFYQNVHNTETSEEVSKLVQDKTNNFFKRFIQIK